MSQSRQLFKDDEETIGCRPEVDNCEGLLFEKNRVNSNNYWPITKISLIKTSSLSILCLNVEYWSCSFILILKSLLSGIKNVENNF